jgi:hypothetical protein
MSLTSVNLSLKAPEVFLSLPTVSLETLHHYLPLRLVIPQSR